MLQLMMHIELQYYYLFEDTLPKCTITTLWLTAVLLDILLGLLLLNAANYTQIQVLVFVVVNNPTLLNIHNNNYELITNNNYLLLLWVVVLLLLC